MNKRIEGRRINFSGIEKIVPKTETAEMDEIMKAQAREYAWWKDVTAYEGEAAVAEAVELGELVPVEDNEACGYKVSANSRESLRFVRPGLKELMDSIGSEWMAQMKEAGESLERTFLVLTSFVRTLEYQQELIDKGYPAADGDKSTHLRGAAFDIGTGWLEDNRPEVVTVLKKALENIGTEQQINVIYEETIRAFHIAVHPDEAYSQYKESVAQDAAE